MESLEPSAFALVMAFNHVGIACFQQGRARIAWDLFKGALEVARDEEHLRENLTPDSSNRYVRQAHYHLQNAGTYTKCSDAPSCLLRALSLNTTMEDEEWANLYLAPSPFEISMSMPLRPAIASVIFNLGLVTQLSNRESSQVIKLYQLAISLVDTAESPKLAMAILNNMAVGYAESGDTEAAQLCMFELTRVEEPNDTRIQANVHMILSAYHQVAPAA